MARTIHVRCIYGILGEEITKNMVHTYGSGQPYSFRAKASKAHLDLLDDGLVNVVPVVLPQGVQEVILHEHALASFPVVVHHAPTLSIFHAHLRAHKTTQRQARGVGLIAHNVALITSPHPPSKPHNHVYVLFGAGGILKHSLDTIVNAIQTRKVL